MQYQNTEVAKFLVRPNRFIAHVDLSGQELRVHVPNTGRCKELFVPGCQVVLVKSDNPNRSTPYSLVAVYKETADGIIIINMDSQAPNKVVYEALLDGSLLGFTPEYIKKEAAFGSSRLDFYFEHPPTGQKAFIEVKGVTLERDGAVFFPDAPTPRGVKHLQELVKAKAAGYEAYAVFVVQMDDAEYFSPNTETHPQFTQALSEAAAAGVAILARSCKVSQDTLALDRAVEVRL